MQVYQSYVSGRYQCPLVDYITHPPYDCKHVKLGGEINFSWLLYL